MFQKGSAKNAGWDDIRTAIVTTGILMHIHVLCRTADTNDADYQYILDQRPSIGDLRAKSSLHTWFVHYLWCFKYKIELVDNLLKSEQFV